MDKFRRTDGQTDRRTDDVITTGLLAFSCWTLKMYKNNENTHFNIYAVFDHYLYCWSRILCIFLFSRNVCLQKAIYFIHHQDICDFPAQFPNNFLKEGMLAIHHSGAHLVKMHVIKSSFNVWLIWVTRVDYCHQYVSAVVRFRTLATSFLMLLGQLSMWQLKKKDRRMSTAWSPILRGQTQGWKVNLFLHYFQGKILLCARAWQCWSYSEKRYFFLSSISWG